MNQFETLLNEAGYAVKHAPTVYEIVPMLKMYSISAVIIGAAWLVHIPTLHEHVPVLTIGNPRKHGYAWFDVASGTPTQEGYCTI